MRARSISATNVGPSTPDWSPVSCASTSATYAAASRVRERGEQRPLVQSSGWCLLQLSRFNQQVYHLWLHPLAVQTAEF